MITRIPQFNIGEHIKKVSISWHSILGTEISAVTTPLYLPGSILLLVVVITCFLQRMEWGDMKKAITESGSMLVKAGFVFL